jgi:TRAP-type mannitol/chloroaromatic compound transport system substrate-binding protein
MKKIVFLSLAIVLALGLMFAGCSSSAAPAEKKVYELKIQSAYPRGDLSADALKVFAESADKKSNGQLKISVFAAPEIVGMFEVPDAVKMGTLDMEHGMGGLWTGVLPIGDIEFGLPYGYKIPEAKDFEGQAEAVRKFYYDEGFIDLLREDYAKQGVYFLDIHVYGPVPFIIASKPVQTLQDIKGLRIRTDGLWMEWENAMGMNGIDMSGDEAYMALKNGTVDAHQWDMSVYTAMGMQEVAPYWIRGMEDDQTVGHILVNMNVWNSLPANLQKALADAAKDYYYETVRVYSEDYHKVTDLVNAGTVTEVKLDKDVIALAEQIGYQLWDEVATRSDSCAKAVDMIRKWRNIK